VVQCVIAEFPNSYLERSPMMSTHMIYSMVVYVSLAAWAATLAVALMPRAVMLRLRVPAEGRG